MFRKNEMVTALEWLLDLFDLDEYENEDGESVDVNDYYFPDIAMVLRDKAETVYQYRMDTDYPKGVNYRGKELFREKAILMCSENESTTFHDNIRICYDNELWRMEPLQSFIVLTRSITMMRCMIRHTAVWWELSKPKMIYFAGLKIF